jgi:hypothetical protein
MQEINFDEAVDLIIAKDPRFTRDALAGTIQLNGHFE